MDEFLSDSEITRFTGYKHHAPRVSWLKQNNVPFKTNGKRKVTVLRRHMLESIEGKRSVECGLNMGAIA